MVDTSRKPPFFNQLLLITCHFLLHFELHIFKYLKNNLGLPSKLNHPFFGWTVESKSQPRGLQLNYS